MSLKSFTGQLSGLFNRRLCGNSIEHARRLITHVK
jgi:hypothetical protein